MIDTSMSSTTSRSSQLARTYLRSECVIVRRTKEDFGGLSNMAAGFPLAVNGVRIRTSEALYQACRFPHLPELQRSIIGQHSPMTAKMKGKPFLQETRPDWDTVKFKIMRWCLRVKLAQNFDAFGRLLLATKDRPIVEQSNKDDYWGARIAPDEETLTGQNVLGRLLMELRERLKQEGSDRLTAVAPLPIADFLLLGRPIKTVTGRTPVPAAPQAGQQLAPVE